MNLSQIQQGILELLLLLQSLGPGQIRGLCSFVVPYISNLSLDLASLSTLVQKASQSELEHLINSASNLHLLEGNGVQDLARTREKEKILQFAVLYIIFNLRVLFQKLSLNQLMKLFEILALAPNAPQDHQSRVLTQLQQLLKQVEPHALQGLRSEMENTAAGDEMAKLSNLVPLEKQDYHLYQPLLGLLQLEEKDLLDLREKLPQLETIHLFLLLKLFVEGSYNMLDFRDLLLPKDQLQQQQIDQINLSKKTQTSSEFISEEQLIQLGLSNDTNEQAAPVEQMRKLCLEIVEQPPERCVYKRNIKPTPTVMIVGGNSNIDGNIYVVPTLIRCDTFEEEPKLITGNRPVRVTSGRVIPFKRLKILSTSHQLKETLFSLRFELRKYSSKGQEYETLHSVTSNPICVLSHSTQLKPAAHTKPMVQDIIPCSGPPSGFTRVAVLGSNFVDSPTTRVRFDNTEVMPIFHGPKTLICHTPRHGPGTVTVHVCNDAKRWSDTAGTFTYDEQMPEEEGKVATSIDQFNLNIASSICEAAFEGGYETVRVLQEKGLDINAADARGFSPMHYTTSHGFTPITKFLLEKGANGSIRDKFGNLPMHYAAQHGHLSDIETLLQFGNSPSSPNFQAFTPLHNAVFNANNEVVDVLVKHGANVQAPLLDGTTPLHIAVQVGKVNIVQKLLRSGAFVDATDDEGETALHWAARLGHLEMARLLLAHGANLEIRNEDMETPLHIAALSSIDVIRLFVGEGAKVREQDEEGATPIERARLNPNATLAVRAMLVEESGLRGLSGRSLSRDHGLDMMEFTARSKMKGLTIKQGPHKVVDLSAVGRCAMAE